MSIENQKAFLGLVRAGLWTDVNLDDNLNLNHNDILNFNDKVDWGEVYRLASEQSVLGLVLQGIERLRGANINLNLSKNLLLQWIGEVQILEQQNKDMNAFIAQLVPKMREAGIYTVLVKGQGIAQCYEKPLWRSCGDVDLLLDAENYEKAKKLLTPMASEVEPEGIAGKHLGMTIENWVVELHGTMRCGLSSRINRIFKALQAEIFVGGSVREWRNGDTLIYLPGADIDVLYVFVHFLNHFYKGGVGIRQICDWCRLLWTYRDSLNHELLEARIRKMGLLTEWRAFGAFAVEYLGMPAEAMPLYDVRSKREKVREKKKAARICSFIMEVGNFGHNRDGSYFSKYPYLIRKAYSLGRRVCDLWNHARIFPLDSLKFFPYILFNGIRSAVRGE